MALPQQDIGALSRQTCTRWGVLAGFQSGPLWPRLPGEESVMALDTGLLGFGHGSRHRFDGAIRQDQLIGAVVAPRQGRGGNLRIKLLSRTHSQF